MKSTIYIVEITNQKNEKYVGRNPVAWSPPRLMSTKKFSAFTKKCFAVFDQSGCVIYLTWYRLIFLGIFFYYSFFQ